jgi:hypothetical protein
MPGGAIAKLSEFLLSAFSRLLSIHSTRPGNSALPQPHREPIRTTIIGSAIGLDLVIKILHRLGFAEVRAGRTPQNDPQHRQTHARSH